MLSNLAVSNPEFISMPFTASLEGTMSEVGGDKKPPTGAPDLLFDFVFLDHSISTRGYLVRVGRDRFALQFCFYGAVFS